MEASLEGAQEIQKVTRGLLSRQMHGPFDDTPSKPGEPPARITGDLTFSIDAELIGTEAWVGPTGLDYARIQELGGDMKGHPIMEWHRWFNGSLTAIKASFVRLPPRPYLEPATAIVVDSGQLEEIYIRYWTLAIEEA